jgi:plastocyanin
VIRILPALFLAIVGPRAQDGALVTGKISTPEGAAQKKFRENISYGANIAGHKDPDPSPAVVWLEGAAPAKPIEAKVEMKQEGLEFRPRVLAIQVGTTLAFPNGDNLYHNVFSYSKVKRIELGRYPKGETKEVTFDKKGRIDLRCEIHGHMRGYIHIFDHPHFAVAKEDGTYAIPKVPPGKYSLVAWKEFFEPVRRDVEVKAGGAKVDLSLVCGTDRAAGSRDESCCGAR